ncbi:hypothetical protein [Flavobacterium sp. CS20]|jgi:hypothetical protein|uniref:hypothetical protein n=1 Tax=Flavobacterium sp. CS20 TaxID=2775246 RepID=UPI001B3A5D76|nr:hypothetical protein [Flavobacterium sp. CS20]QTY27795.1 hypothetical protein IGB25_04540 [Flavobacterium sp. CS20]
MVSISCSEDVNEFDSKSEIIYQNKKPKVSVSVSATLHRGRRWSERHNVEPCTTSFGLCNVRVTATVSSRTSNDNNESRVIFETTDNLNVIRLIFEEQLNYDVNEIFISNEDDDFILPDDISESLGYNRIIILAKNYVVNYNDSSLINGYVDLDIAYE